ncbi:MAG: hypothetical protein HYZ26_13310 [Chloroflexi bacterium]|nr:hypothetical protein [Chloroflexota bacterium]
MGTDKPSLHTQLMSWRLYAGLAGWLALALALAWAGNRGAGLANWAGWLGVLALCAGLLWGGLRLLRGEGLPGWVRNLTLLAFALRLGLGVFWFYALPVWGYDTDVQRAGYVMDDAHKRDGAAWKMAKEDTPLWESFRGYSTTDQYGGLLFLSALVYRYLGGSVHHPLMMLSVSAAASALAVAFAWTFTRRLWSDTAARWAAWGLALYPEAVLLGSSQMREAFSVTLIAVTIWLTLKLADALAWKPALALAVSLLAGGLLSPPIAALQAAMALLLYPAVDEGRLLTPRRKMILIPLAALAGLALAALFWPRLAAFFDAAAWQRYVAGSASGWVARQFERMPAWSHVVFLLVYGVFRPLLPAALVADGAVLWKIVAILRAASWTLLLGMLLYATFLALRGKAWRGIPGALLLGNWLVALVASYRGGGDDWDNPRYRAAFAAVQLALAAWALLRQRETGDPWLRRAFGFAGGLMLWFLPWYLRRYAPFEWPIVDLPDVIGLGLGTGALYAVWDWLGEKR